MKFKTSIFYSLLCTAVVAQNTTVTVSITGRTDTTEADKVAIQYPSFGGNSSHWAPLLIGNDGSAGTGGFRTWTLPALSQRLDKRTGRTKLVTTVGKYLVTLSQEDSFIRAFDTNGKEKASKKIWGDFSSICVSGQYMYLFGKKQVRMLALLDKKFVEITVYTLPIEAEACVVSPRTQRVLFGGSDGVVYALNAIEKVLAQPLSTVKNLGSKVESLGIYYGPSGEEHIFVVADGMKVFDFKFRLLGDVSFKAFGAKKIEIGDIALFQQPLANFSQGIMAVAMKSSLGKQFGIAPLAGVLSEFQIAANTTYHPVKEIGNSKICKKCNYQGFCADEGKCDCFIGTAGTSCKDSFCQGNCSGHGKCIGANECRCEKGWDGPDCSFVIVQPSYETEANGEDGDDPAVWIHPTDASLSRVITTTKSTAGAGLTMFDLTGKKLGSISAGEPNNVDVLYNVTLGSRKVDLAYAACRKDNTLCLFEITNNGTLVNVSGGSQPTRKGFKVYGSCVYSSKKTGKNYLFVNAKDATYLQYELTSTPDGQLNTTLVRQFIGGNGGQVEGCVSDDENGFIFVGEEPYGLWRFGAEPNSSPEGFLVDSVNGTLFADVEGVTLVPGKTKDDGFILVSCQGVSAYNVYQRKLPHKFVMTFTIHPSEDGKVDGVTITDGVTAVGKKLNKDFPYGILVVHDDVNQLPNGERSSQASFKMLSLEKVLASQPGLLKQIDKEWNPRS